MENRSIVRAFAPASVSNVACGFDVMGFAVENLGDQVVAQSSPVPGVSLSKVEGDGGRLPRDARRNTAGVAARALLEAAGSQEGVILTLNKGMPLSSGLGSSAASAVAAAFAVDRLLNLGAPPSELLRCAMLGEAVACGSAHPDNAAPSLYGGLVLIRPADPPEVIRLPVPDGLSCAVIRPHIEVETRASRGVLGSSVPLEAAVAQWGNLGALIAGLFRDDLELISRALVDSIAEPKRAGLIPGFERVKGAAIESGALGCSLSGSGPSIFALCATRALAESAADAMEKVFAEHGLASDRLVTAVGCTGVRDVSSSQEQ